MLKRQSRRYIGRLIGVYFSLPRRIPSILLNHNHGSPCRNERTATYLPPFPPTGSRSYSVTPSKPNAFFSSFAMVTHYTGNQAGSPNWGSKLNTSRILLLASRHLRDVGQDYRDCARTVLKVANNPTRFAKKQIQAIFTISKAKDKPFFQQLQATEGFLLVGQLFTRFLCLVVTSSSAFTQPL